MKPPRLPRKKIWVPLIPWFSVPRRNLENSSKTHHFVSRPSFRRTGPAAVVTSTQEGWIPQRQVLPSFLQDGATNIRKMHRNAFQMCYQLLQQYPRFKVHLTPKNVFRSIESTRYSKHLGAKIFEFAWILDFLCPLKVALEVLHDRVLGSLGRRLLMTSTQEPNTMAPQSALCSCSRKWKAKLIVPIYFGTKTSEYF